MRPTWTIPKLGGLPELRSWECVGCGVHFTGASRQRSSGGILRTSSCAYVKVYREN
jgi:hypothetical protein